MAKDLTGTWIASIAGSKPGTMTLKVNETGSVEGTYRFEFLTRGQGDTGKVQGIFHSPTAELRGEPLQGDPRYRWEAKGTIDAEDRLKLSPFGNENWDFSGAVFRRK